MGRYPRRGKKLNLQTVDVFRLKDGHITSLHAYFDNVDFMTQLGPMPAQSG